MTGQHSYDRNSLCCLRKWSKTCCLTFRSHFGRQANVNTRILVGFYWVLWKCMSVSYELLIYFHVNYTDMFSKQIYWIDILPRNMKPCRMLSFYWIISLKLPPHQLARCHHQHSWLLWSPDGRWHYLNVSPLSSSEKDTPISPTIVLHPNPLFDNSKVLDCPGDRTGTIRTISNILL